MPSPALSPVSAPARPAVPVLPGFMPGPAWVLVAPAGMEAVP